MALATGLLVGSGVASAQEGAAGAPSRGEPDRVAFLLQEASPAAGVLLTFDSVQGQLGELELELVIVHVAQPEQLADQARHAAEIAAERNVAAVFWFAPGEAGSLRVYALHAPSRRVFARDVGLAGSAIAQREQVAIVLRAAVPAVLEGGHDLGKPLLVVAAEPAVDAPPVPPPPASDRTYRSIRRPPSRALRAGLGYGGAVVAPEARWQSGVLGVLVGDAGRRLRGGLNVGYAAPTTLEGEGADARLTRFDVALTLGARCTFADASLALEGGPRVEAWHRRTIVRSDALEPTDPRTQGHVGATLLTRFELRLGERTGLFLLAGADWLATAHRFTIRAVGGESKLEPYLLRPQAAAGLAVDLLPRTRK